MTARPPLPDLTYAAGVAAVAEPTTVRCPACATPVVVGPADNAVACPACSTAFSPWGMQTTARTSSDVSPDGHPGTAAHEDLVGHALSGRRLERIVGRGGMGTVYEALDPVRGRVAVKVLPPALAADPAFLARFRREADVLASLSHPHLVEVFDRGDDDGRCWFAMEHVEGGSLRRRIEAGALPPSEALRIAREILTGLAYAHGRGVVHRDLKPENILLDATGRVRLVDFGLSRIVGGEAAEDLSRLTRTNVILGTYEYMAPEQRLGGIVTERADLYAVGVLLYEMLTAALPLGRFEAPSTRRPGTPRALDDLVLRALSGDPNDRFPSAVAFLEALDAAARATDDPVPMDARPSAIGPPRTARSGRPIRPLGELIGHGLLVWALTVLAVAVVFLLGSSASDAGARSIPVAMLVLVPTVFTLLWLRWGPRIAILLLLVAAAITFLARSVSGGHRMGPDRTFRVPPSIGPPPDTAPTHDDR